MGSRRTLEGTQRVYTAAAAWVTRALRSDDSLFTPGKAIWTRELLGELHRRFLGNFFSFRGRGFFEKLGTMLGGAQPEVCQLMAETVFVGYLIIHEKTVGPEKKRENINKVLALTSPSLSIPDDLADGLAPGIAKSQFFAAFLPHHFAFVLEFAKQWKDNKNSLAVLDRTDYYASWQFRNFVLSVRVPFSAIIQRQAMMHLVYPDTFEGVVDLKTKGAHC